MSQSLTSPGAIPERNPGKEDYNVLLVYSRQWNSGCHSITPWGGVKWAWKRNQWIIVLAILDVQSRYWNCFLDLGSLITQIKLWWLCPETKPTKYFLWLLASELWMMSGNENDSDNQIKSSRKISSSILLICMLQFGCQFQQRNLLNIWDWD